MSTRSAFITGAAAGIGLEIARRFAREGWTVGLYDIDGATAVRQAEELGGVGGALDVADPAAWQKRLEEFATATGGRLDVLVNNAGVLTSGPFEMIPIERHHQIIDVNVKGVLNGCHAAFPHLLTTPGAQVINLSSASALYGQPHLLTYAASKAAVASVTEALGLEWRRHGIRVSDLQPLYVSTAMADAAKGSATVGSLGVRLTPQDVADAVWRTAHRRRPRVHTRPGLQGKVMAAAGRFTPTAVTRALVARLSGM